MSAALLANFKAAFARSRLHLNNAGLAPISRDASETLKTWAERFYQEGYFTDRDYMDQTEEVRAQLAAMLGVAYERMAFFSSTAVALSQLAFCMPLQPGDEVLMFEQEYGSNLFPWREACSRSGAKLVTVESGPGLSAPAERLLQHVTAATKVIAVSSVQYQTGAVVDLASIASTCAPRGIFLCVDAMQSVGLHPFNLHKLGVDAVAGGSHKWLVSPVGVGYLGMSERLAKMQRPLSFGAQSYGSCDLPTTEVCDLKTDASKLEPGSKATAEILALGASVALINKTGLNVIAGEALRLADLLRSGLVQRGYTLIDPYQPSDPHRSPIVTFLPGPKAKCKDNQQALASLQKAGILGVIRGGGVRLSPHAFNLDSDIAAALAAL